MTATRSRDGYNSSRRLKIPSCVCSASCLFSSPFAGSTNNTNITLFIVHLQQLWFDLFLFFHKVNARPTVTLPQQKYIVPAPNLNDRRYWIIISDHTKHKNRSLIASVLILSFFVRWPYGLHLHSDAVNTNRVLADSFLCLHT